MTFFVKFLSSYGPCSIGENDFRSIFCEIMDRFRSNFGSLFLVQSSVCPFVNNLQWVSCERNSFYSFLPIILKRSRCFSHVVYMC